MSREPTIPRQLAGITRELAIASIPPAILTFIIGMAVLVALAQVFPASSLVPVAVATVATLGSIVLATKKWVRYLST